jgi:hypothetical protein
VFAVAFCAATSAIGFSGCTGGGIKTVQTAPQLVSLEAANSPGSSPWMDSAASADLPTELNRVENTSTPSPGSQGAMQTVSGDQVGLYGGSMDHAVCDREKMVNFLEQNPPKAHAWQSATGASDIGVYAGGLSPVVLTHDTRVTNHGFDNGDAPAFQSVLQTGTAVLVDNRGIPRVRCESGSPLTEPQGGSSPQFTGTGWQGLDPNSFVTVKPSSTSLDKLQLVSVAAPGAPQPETPFVEVKTGETRPRLAPDIVLPHGTALVPVKVAPPLTPTTSTVASSVTSSSRGTTTTPSTTTRGGNPSVSSSSTPPPKPGVSGSSSSTASSSAASSSAAPGSKASSTTSPVHPTTQAPKTSSPITSVPTVPNHPGTLPPVPR